MDPLSLLCTLHADGPQTLKRLRSAGCDSLQVLVSYDPAALAKILDVADAVARRLAREARLLVNRVEAPALEREEPAPVEHSAQAAPAVVATAPTQETTPEDLNRRDRELLQRVMDRWHTTDDDPAPAQAEPRTVAPQEVSPASVSDLVANAVDGLTPELSASLRAGGIETLAQLAQADAGALAQQLAVPFATIRRVQFLAGRATAAPQASQPVQQPVRPVAPARSPGGFSPVHEDAGIAEALEYASADDDGEGTVLDWNFEIPPPPTRAPAGYDDPSGPFA